MRSWLLGFGLLVCIGGCGGSSSESKTVTAITQPIKKTELAPISSVKKPSAKWKEYTSNSAGFTVLMPGMPAGQTRSQKNATVHFLTVPADKSGDSTGYVITYSDFDELVLPLDKSNESLLNFMTKGVSQGMGGKILSEKNISLQGYVGREIKFDIEPQNMTAVSKMFVTDGRLYQVTAIAQKNKLSKTGMSALFNSFRFTKSKS